MKVIYGYIGANPNNYITFNGEKAGWRIIGVFKDIDDGTGRKEWRTKIIKSTSIGNKEWDASSNDWNTADIKDELNDTYLNGLINEAKSAIGNTKWNIGKASTSSQNTFGYYAQERSGATWTGKIGLMYPSDYGYAVGGVNRTSCLSYTLDSWSGHNECKVNDWLFNGSNQWTITAYTANSSYVFITATGSHVGYNSVGDVSETRPVFYLTPETAIISGSGTSNDTYVIEA